MRRSPTFQNQWFEEVARSAQRWGIGPDRFFDEVRERLEKGAKEYGEDQWTTVGLLGLIREVSEEATDIPGWLVLAAQQLNLELGEELIDGGAAMEIQQEFLAIAAYGLLAHERLRKASYRYRTARAHAEWRRKLPEGHPEPVDAG